MGYFIEYDPQLNKRYPAQRKAQKQQRLLIPLLLTAAAIGVLWGGGLLQYLIPGDPEITVSAIQSLIEQVSRGEPVKEAVIAFCREIIVYAS